MKGQRALPSPFRRALEADGHPGATSLWPIRSDLDTIDDLKLIDSMPTTSAAPVGSPNPSLPDGPAPRLP